jgi:hypothetical protein
MEGAKDGNEVMGQEIQAGGVHSELEGGRGGPHGENQGKYEKERKTDMEEGEWVWSRAQRVKRMWEEGRPGKGEKTQRQGVGQWGL